LPKWNGTTWVCGGFMAGSFSPGFSDVVDNTVSVEISGSFQGNVVVINGPGFQIERIPGFLGDGRPMESAGPNAEFPFVFEYAGPQVTSLQALHDSGQARSLSMIVTDLAGQEMIRLNMYEYYLTRIEGGDGGRNRYTFETHDPPDNLVRLQDGGGLSAPSESSNNPATDTRIEIDGIRVGFYPAVVVDAVNRTITLTFDYIESGDAFYWARNTAIGSESRRSMSVIQESGGTEVSRTNYFEVFPIVYQQLTGFGQVEKFKVRLVIAYGYSQAG
jgi:hypothetical protein